MTLVLPDSPVEQMQEIPLALTPSRSVQPEPVPGLSRRRRGGRVAPLCDETSWCGLTLYQHQAPHREAIVIELTEMDENCQMTRRRIELCSWPCVENLGAARSTERSEDERQRKRREESRRAVLGSALDF